MEYVLLLIHKNLMLKNITSEENLLTQSAIHKIITLMDKIQPCVENNYLLK